MFNYSSRLVIFVVIISLFLAGCGEDKKKDEKKETSVPENSVTLANEFASASAIPGLSFRFPVGWIVSERGSGIVMSDNETVLNNMPPDFAELNLEPGAKAMRIEAIPVGDLPSADLVESLGTLVETVPETITFGEAKAFTLGENKGGRIDITAETYEGELFLVEAGEFILVIISVASDYDTLLAESEAIVNSIMFTAN